MRCPVSGLLAYPFKPALQPLMPADDGPPGASERFTRHQGSGPRMWVPRRVGAGASPGHFAEPVLVSPTARQVTVRTIPPMVWMCPVTMAPTEFRSPASSTVMMS